MPNLYLLHRGLSSISSAEQSATILSSPSWDSDAVTIGEKNLYFHEVGGMVRTLEREIESDLQKVLFDCDEFLEPFETQIFDEPRRTVPGYSFLDDPRNPWHAKKALIEHILESPSLFKRFGSVSEDKAQIDWHTGAISAWLKEVFDLQEKFLIAIVLTYGEPARSTELVSNLVRNYPGGSIRNVYHAYGTFFLRGSYNKTSFFTGKDKVMARAPLPSLSRLFVMFLAYVRPLFSEWQRIIRPKMHHNSHYYLFCGLWRPLTSIDLSKSLARFTEQYLDVRIPSSLHRQIMAFITSRYRRVFPAGTVSSSTDEQLGHSQKMDRKHYGLDARIPGQMDHESLQLSLEVSGIFHRILCMDTTLLHEISLQQVQVRNLATEIDAIRNPSQSANILSGLSTSTPIHSAEHIAKGVSQHLAPFLTQQIKDRVERSNAAIVHLFAPQRVTSESTHVLPSAIVNTHASLIPRLREMFPNQSNHGFSNIQQAQATQLAIERERSFLLIMATGAGKTLPALIASKFYDGGRTTVWVLPLRSLRDLIKEHCAKHGLEVRAYDHGLSVADTPRNLIVTIEMTETEDFQKYLKALCSGDRIARIVLDEAHLLLTHKSFRPIMGTLNWLGQRSIQLVLLTATLPINLVNRITTELSLSAPLVLRTTTERPNISINVTVVDSHEAVKAAVTSTYQRIQQTGPNDRVLIFARSRAEVSVYSEELGIPQVHAEMDLEEIEAILAKFRSGLVHAICCTSFLGVGLDVPDVVHVIHAGLPWDLLSYSQEAGRLGRSRTAPKAWSHIIVNRNDLSKQKDDEFGAGSMREFLLNDKNCRRIVPWTYIDGSALPCSMLTPNTHLCDVCEADSRKTLAETFERPPVVLAPLPKGPSPPVFPPLPPSAKPTLAISARVSQLDTSSLPTLPNSYTYRSLVKFGKYFAVHCARCHLAKLSDGHLFSQCPQIDHSEYGTWCKALCRRLADTYCLSCGIPKDVSASRTSWYTFTDVYADRIQPRYRCEEVGSRMDCGRTISVPIPQRLPPIPLPAGHQRVSAYHADHPVPWTPQNRGHC